MSTEPSVPDPLCTGPFDGRHAFQRVVRSALDAAARENWREIIFSDAGFADWPLGERSTIDGLQAWAAAGRSFHLIANDFSVFASEHARFVSWRQRWDHIITCSLCSGNGAPPVPSAIWTPAWFMRRIDTERCRGLSGAASEGGAALRQALKVCLTHSRPGFGASTLGL